MSELIKRVAGEAEELGRTALERVGVVARRDAGQDSGPEAHSVVTVRRAPEEIRAVLADRVALRRVLGRDARVLEDGPGQGLRFVAPEGAETPFEGSVEFSPGPAEWGTEVSLTLRVDAAPAAGPVGKGVSLAARPLVVGSLHRLKALVETGEIPTLERNPSARPGEGDQV